MAVRTDKSVVYHIPKCGGIWVKEAIRQSGIQYGRCRDLQVEQPFNLKREHAPPSRVRDEDKEGRFAFCFVRHPVDWLKSFWAYRVKTNYLDQKFPADRQWDDVFEQFVWNILEAYPDGFVTRMYQFYVGEMDFVGRQENLTDDLVKALTLAGEEFNEADLRRTRWRNISSKGKRLSRLCVLSDETYAKACQSDKWVIETYYDDVEVFK